MSHEELIESSLGFFDRNLENLLSENYNPIDDLTKAINYALAGKGKRVRPLLALLSAFKAPAEADFVQPLIQAFITSPPFQMNAINTIAIVISIILSSLLIQACSAYTDFRHCYCLLCTLMHTRIHITIHTVVCI